MEQRVGCDIGGMEAKMGWGRDISSTTIFNGMYLNHFNHYISVSDMFYL